MENNKNSKKNKSLKIVVPLLALLLMLGLGFWAYSSQQSKLKQKDNEITQLEDQLSEANKKNAENAANQQSSSTVDSTSTSDQDGTQDDSSSYLDIKEFKIKVKLDENTKDAIYVIKSYTDNDGTTARSAYLSTRALSAKDSECSAEKGAAGAINEDGSFTGPQALCSDGSSESLETAISQSFAKAEIVKY
jgi:cytoskeletal protein RodZ